MKADLDLLYQFEKELEPTNLNRSKIPVKLLGYGEISSIFQIGDNDQIIYIYANPAFIFYKC